MSGGAAIVVVAVAIVLLRAPSPVAARLRALRGRSWTGIRWPGRRRTDTGIGGGRGGIGIVLPALCGAGGLAAWASVGFGAAVPLLPAAAGGITGGTVAGLLAGADRLRRRSREAAALVESVGLLAADLRAGAQPADAVGALAADPRAVPATRHRAVTAVWAVAAASGAPAATVLEQVERDLRAREQQRREVAAQLAGARSTGGMLAVLPVLGLGLGAAMGADPLAVLLGTPRGQLALLLGVGLEAVGVLWTARIVARAEATP